MYNYKIQIFLSDFYDFYTEKKKKNSSPLPILHFVSYFLHVLFQSIAEVIAVTELTYRDKFQNPFKLLSYLG